MTQDERFEMVKDLLALARAGAIGPVYVDNDQLYLGEWKEDAHELPPTKCFVSWERARQMLEDIERAPLAVRKPVSKEGSLKCKATASQR